jgi:hypothetical protein
MKSIYKIITLFGISLVMFSCHDTKSPNYEYFPNMYESVGYETYSESKAFADGKEGQLPAKGTIKRGFVPYGLPNTNEGYEASKLVVKSQLDSTMVDMEKSKELFNIYCAICHGEKGNGKGKLVEREKILGVPSYADRNVTVGSVYHIMTYGINSMGAYSNQLDQKERWMVAQYVMKLKSEL